MATVVELSVAYVSHLIHNSHQNDMRVACDVAYDNDQMALRASSLTSENKRRTLQRNDIAMAVSKTDTYDFLIDIVPRDEVKR